MLTLFSTIKAYYLFSSDVVNTEIINIKEIANLSKLIMFIMSFRFLEMIYMYALLLKESISFLYHKIVLHKKTNVHTPKFIITIC